MAATCEGRDINKHDVMFKDGWRKRLWGLTKRSLRQAVTMDIAIAVLHQSRPAKLINTARS